MNEQRLHGLQTLVTWIPVVVIAILLLLCLLLILRSSAIGPFHLPRRRERKAPEEDEQKARQPKRRSWFWPRYRRRSR